MGRSYQDLDVYNRSFAIAIDIHKLSLELPKLEQYALADQMRRASKSICSNIAEGQAKAHYSKAEFKRFLFMAVGSSEEMRVWLNFCKELEYLDAKTWSNWDDEYDQISKMLNGLIRTLQLWQLNTHNSKTRNSSLNLNRNAGLVFGATDR